LRRREEQRRKEGEKEDEEGEEDTWRKHMPSPIEVFTLTKWPRSNQLRKDPIHTAQG
jgi:hypothetical protein